METTACRTHPKNSFIVQAAAVAIISAAAHISSLSVGFYYDDVNQVLMNSWIRDVRYVPAIFSSNVWGFMSSGSDFYRPMMHIIHMLCYYVFGLSPWGYHLVNVLLHCAVSVLVFMVARKLLAAPREATSIFHSSPPFIAALLFAVNPLHSDTVTWVAGVQDLSCAFFFMLALYLYIRSAGQYRQLNPYLFLSAASFMFAALSKESSLSLPLVLAAYDIAFRERPLRIREGIKRYAPFLVVVLTYLALRYSALGGMIRPFVKLSVYENIINMPYLFAMYLLKLLFPTRLSLLHVIPHLDGALDPRAVISFITMAVFVALFYAAWRRDKTAFIGFALITAPLLPALYIPAITMNKFAAQQLYLPFAERYLYLSSIGFVLLMVSLLARLHARKQITAAGFLLACLFVAVIYSAGTVKRTLVWQSDLGFWQNEVKVSPEMDAPHVNLGMAYGMRGRSGPALEQFREAVRINPDNEYAHNNIGIIYSHEGLPDKAIEEFRTAVNLKPVYANALFNLGLEFLKKGAVDDAIDCLDAAVKLIPSDREFQDALNEAYMLKGGS
jgi:tetratricopeptide (TPR) repeat protein